MSYNIWVVIERVVVVEVDHDDSAHSDGLLRGVLHIEQFEVFTRHYVLFLLNDVDLAIDFLSNPNVLNVAVARFVVASLFNAGVEPGAVGHLLNDEIHILGEALMRGEL